MHRFKGQYRCGHCRRWHESDINMITVIFFNRMARFCDERCKQAKVEIYVGTAA